MELASAVALLLIGELVYSVRANDPDAFRQWLSGGIQDLGEPVVEELLLDWLYSFLTVEEQDRLLGWHLGVSLLPDGGCQALKSGKKMVLLGEVIPSWNRDGVFTGREPLTAR